MSDRLFLSVRWGLSAALAYLVLFDQSDGTGPNELLFVGALLGSNLVASRLERWLTRDRAFVVLLGADSALVLLGLMLADTASQDLVVGYFVCILLASLADSERKLIGLSLLATGLYGFVGLHGGEDVWRSALLLRFPLLVLVTLSYGLLVTRLRAEEAARAAAERRAVNLETVLALTRDLVSTLSTAEILERSRRAVAQALVARDCRVVRFDDPEEEAAPLVARAIASGRSTVFADGGSRSVLAVPLTHGGEALGAIVAELDRGETEIRAEEIEFCQITADAAALALGNARQYEALAEVERRKTDFLRNLSHEMHTPLHAILGFAEIASQSVDEEDRGPLRRALERISTRAQEMSVHIEHLLRLSQLTMGRERAVPTVVDLPMILSRSLADARRTATRSLDLHLEVPAGVERVIVDGEKLERIVDCLLLNAVKFTERGRIELAAAIDGRNVLHLSVRDEGVGVSDADSLRIFEDFAQGDGSTTRRFPGLGLGLAVSRRLAELLGGEIKVARGAGRGATFELVVPVEVPLPI